MPTLSRSLVLLALLLCLAAQALAAGPAATAQAPGFYRLQLGQYQVTALLDGHSELDVKLLKYAQPGEAERLLGRMFVPAPKMPTAVNAYLVNTGSQLVLVDAGTGAHRGPRVGHLLSNLRAAGYAPEQVDLILLTHMHGDHVGGLADASGAALFPKARLLAAPEELAYWTSAQAEAAAAEGRRPSFAFARRMIAAYQAAGRFGVMEPGSSPVPGITALAIPGHTPGHLAFAVESGGQKLLMVGDLVHAHAVQFARPGVAIEFDADAAQAVATRRRVLQEAAASGVLLGGMHLPFPGLGRVRAEGPDAYAWVPLEFAPLPPAK